MPIYFIFALNFTFDHCVLKDAYVILQHSCRSYLYLKFMKVINVIKMNYCYDVIQMLLVILEHFSFYGKVK